MGWLLATSSKQFQYKCILSDMDMIAARRCRNVIQMSRNELWTGHDMLRFRPGECSGKKEPTMSIINLSALMKSDSSLNVAEMDKRRSERR